MIDIRSSKKIVILGDSSSGKSVLAKFLSEKLDIPNISIDESLFDSNGNKISDAILENKIQAVLIQDSWIIEGNSFPVLLEERIRGADTVIFFDMTPLVSLWNVFKRDIKSLFGVEREGYKSKEIIFNFKYYLPYLLIRFPKRKQHLKELLKKYQDKNIILIHNKKDLNKFYSTFKNS